MEISLRLIKSLYFISGAGSVFCLFSGYPKTVQLPYPADRTIRDALTSDWSRIYSDMARSWETIQHELLPHQ